MAILDVKVLKKKKLDKELNLRILKNEAAERIFVEFSSKNGKLILQKSFQDTFAGRTEAENFEKSIKTFKQLKAHFGLK